MFKRIRELLLGSKSGSKPAETSASEMPSSRGSSEPLTAPFELVPVTGAEAAATWEVLRKRPAIAPVLLGNREAAERMLEIMQGNDESFESIRDAGLQLDVDAWIARQVQDDPERFVVDETRTGPVDPLPAFSPASNILTGQPYPEVLFGLIPVEAPWLVPAYLKFGGWNDCPDAVVQLAFFRRWYERHGAVVTTVADDIIEFNVARPPRTPEAARQLAWEQYVYCTDVVDQGVQTLGNLAAALQGSTNWYFWWD